MGILCLLGLADQPPTPSAVMFLLTSSACRCLWALLAASSPMLKSTQRQGNLLPSPIISNSSGQLLFPPVYPTTNQRSYIPPPHLYIHPPPPTVSSNPFKISTVVKLPVNGKMPSNPDLFGPGSGAGRYPCPPRRWASSPKVP